MKSLFLLLITISLFSIQINNATAQDWKPVPGHIMTPWAEDVTPDNAWKEYPRPQLVRKEWVNLNGLWDFDLRRKLPRSYPAQRYSQKILVPFCVESALSGVKKRVRGSQEMVYSRALEFPDTWRGKRIVLHFQAVDYLARVWIDDKYMGEHKGGYDSFSFDITDALNPSGEHKLELVVWDPTNEGTQPIGKQNLPEFFHNHRYEPTSGIWQTVWMEPVEDVSIQKLKVTPDIDNEILIVEVDLKGWGYDHLLKIQAFDKGKEIASVESVPGETAKLKINKPILWSPDNPYLYDLKVSLLNGNEVLDEVESYFGMRKISMARNADGYMMIHLNDKEIFQLGPLDQGYWPDGILLPASDVALKYDIEYLKKIGCNMSRVHVKVHPERWYYHCDKLGLLVWQDMVCPWTSLPRRSDFGGSEEFELEWNEIMEQFHNYPSIVTWVVFNEAWTQYDTERLTNWTKRKDPSRLVINTSGWTDRNVGDIRDFHDYTLYPSVAWTPKYYNRAMVIGEGGGFDIPFEGHLWDPGQTLPDKIDLAGDLIREGYNSVEVFEERYTLWVNNVSLLRKYGLNAMVYTQISDVELEINGWMTYDRKVSKIPEARLAKIHSVLFEAPKEGKDIIPLSIKSPQDWQYSFSEPAKDWYSKDNSGKWESGKAPFGISQMNTPEVNTKWDTPTLFLQKDFNVEAVPSEIGIVTHNNAIVDIYINGEFVMQIFSIKTQDKELKVSEVPLPAEAVSLLKKGTNHIAVKFEFGNSQPLYHFDLGLIEY